MELLLVLHLFSQNFCSHYGALKNYFVFELSGASCVLKRDSSQ